ncbi:hypothetical protein H312_00087 [Anncaliia algerae PRA339]|uniref:SUEL-type lectin domain-containing protein n=1 Tax=Anncaliia algerae PRA339 TaxID=1288291 RepID=A0A059F5Z6_9MICR|nr:hypothetical protein H312_00087 [Anncaliia algerae PRA339]
MLKLIFFIHLVKLAESETEFTKKNVEITTRKYGCIHEKKIIEIFSTTCCEYVDGEGKTQSDCKIKFKDLTEENKENKMPCEGIQLLSNCRTNIYENKKSGKRYIFSDTICSYGVNPSKFLGEKDEKSEK